MPTGKPIVALMVQEKTVLLSEDKRMNYFVEHVIWGIYSAWFCWQNT